MSYEDLKLRQRQRDNENNASYHESVRKRKQDYVESLQKYVESKRLPGNPMTDESIIIEKYLLEQKRKYDESLKDYKEASYHQKPFYEKQLREDKELLDKAEFTMHLYEELAMKTRLGQDRHLLEEEVRQKIQMSEDDTMQKYQNRMKYGGHDRITIERAESKMRDRLGRGPLEVERAKYAGHDWLNLDDAEREMHDRLGRGLLEERAKHARLAGLGQSSLAGGRDEYDKFGF
jgi:hypothetical protein